MNSPILMTTIQKEQKIGELRRQLDECLAILALLVHKNNNEISFEAHELTSIPDLLFSVSQEDGKVTLKLIEQPDEEPIKN